MLLRVFGLLHFFSSRNAHRCLQPVLCLFRFGWSVDTGQAVEVISSVGEAGSRVTRDKSDIWAHFQLYLSTLSKHQNCVQAASTSISPCSKPKTTLSHLVPFIVYISTLREKMFSSFWDSQSFFECTLCVLWVFSECLWAFYECLINVLWVLCVFFEFLWVFSKSSLSISD